MTPEEAARRLAPEAWQRHREDLLPRILFVVEGNTKKRTPVRTGHLRRSETSKVIKAGERGVMGTNVIYARPVNARARFMEKGLDDSLTEINRLAAEAGARFFAEVAG